MSSYSLQVPEGLKPSHCEKPGSENSDVPVRYIMTQISEDDIRKVTIKLPDGNRLEVTVYTDENAEVYLRMLRDHSSLAIANDSVKDIKDALADRKFAFDKHKPIKVLDDPTREQKALGAKYLKDWGEARKKCKVIAVKAFSLVRRMLDGTAKDQWDIIDDEVHNDSTHTDLQGLTVAGPKGRSWATLNLCIEKHKLNVFKTDAADEQRRYISHDLRKPYEVKIRWFMQRVMSMNNNLSLMPCLAINTQTSDETVAANIPFNETELCGIIIRCLPQAWQTQYVLANGQKKQTKTRDLLIQLEAIEKVMDQKRKDLSASTKKDSSAKSGKTGKSSEKRRSNGSGDSRIPKKQRTEKFCNRCKENGGAHTTHNTSDCNRYKADGSPNKDYGTKSAHAKKGKGGKDRSYNKGGGDKQSISHLTAALDKVKKQLKKLKKSHGKKRKRHSRHHSSDSSSSGSDTSE